MTTTTSALVAKLVPSYQGVAPVPPVKPPPWIHTMTGRAGPSVAGVITLSDRQSSSQAPVDCAMPATRLGACQAMGPKRVASRTPAHGLGGSGRAKRRCPVGGAA